MAQTSTSAQPFVTDTSSASTSSSKPQAEPRPQPRPLRIPMDGPLRIPMDGPLRIPMDGPLRIPPRRIALCGGGMRCIAHVGVMKALKKANLLHSVTEVIGVSGGALFALLFSLGYTLNDIERLSLQFDFTLLRSIDVELACMFPITFGLDTGENLEKLIDSILRQKGFSASTTFAEMASVCPMLFRCYATEIQSSTIREFSAKTTPTTSVLFAVRASMSLPFLYTPVKDPHSSDILMDGGVLHNHPISFLTREEAADTLSVQFIEENSYQSPQEEPGILDMVRYVYNGVIRLRANPYDTIYPENILSIAIGSAETAVSFEQSLEDKAASIAIGEQKTTTFLQGNQRPLPRRRFSAA